MNNGFFLVTGTSKGIGEALAQYLLDQGHTVIGVARTCSDKLKSASYHHLTFDLAETTHISKLMKNVDQIVNGHSFDFLCLINNASAVDPLGFIQKCPPAQIDRHVRVGLIAPMILTSLFIQKYIDNRIRKKVAFISSGAALQPLSNDSIYCSSKAGLYMFAQCIGLEQIDRNFGFEVISIGPGMVDTPMQLKARLKSNEEYAWADFSKQAFTSGKLQKPQDVAAKIYTILENKYEQGKYVRVSEV